MTREQIDCFNSLLNDSEFKGKKQLRHLLWLNTTKPKYEMGDCFLVDSPGEKIFGRPVEKFHAKVVKISSWRDEEEYQYELTGMVKCKDKQITTNFYCRESDLRHRCEDSVTIIE